MWRAGVEILVLCRSCIGIGIPIDADDDESGLGVIKSGYFVWLKAFYVYLHTRDLAFLPTFLPPCDD